MLVVFAAALSLTLQLWLLPGGRTERKVGDLVRVVVVAIGWITIVVVVDFGVGQLVGGGSGSTGDDAVQVATVADGQIPRDPRADSDAMAGLPWAEDYFNELAEQRYEYEPYTTTVLGASSGQFINTAQGVRQSYQPVGANGNDAVEVWFFGGSTMFGEGQRDGFTIPSAIARLAEADGVTLRVVNFGHQGEVHWQEMLRFEAAAAAGSGGLAVFYDGVNDFNTGRVDTSGQPSHSAFEVIAKRLAEAAALPGSVDEPDVSVWEQYRDTSAVSRLASSLSGSAMVLPAAADEGSGDDSGPEGESFEESGIDAVERIRATYGRAVEMTRRVARNSDIPVRVFWQPIGLGFPDYAEVAASLPAGVTDISDTFDGVTEPIFIDGGHTNELGARLVAERIYDEIADDLRALAGRSS